MNKILNQDCHIGASIDKKYVEIEIGFKEEKFFSTVMRKSAFEADFLRLISEAFRKEKSISHFYISDKKTVLEIDMKNQILRIYSRENILPKYFFSISLAPIASKFHFMIQNILEKIEEKK